MSAPAATPTAIGVATFAVTVDPSRTLTAAVWYPTADATSPTVRYLDVIPGQAHADAPALAGPRLPVVMMSHGWGGKKEHAAYLAERLAAAGYLVAAVDHGVDSQATAFLRPRDLSALLDALADPAKVPAGVAARADLERVAVYGHSFGGFTALAVGGAAFGPNPQWDAHCATGEPALDCPAPPAGAMPTLEMGDPRVDLVMAAAPAGYFIFGDAGLGKVAVPSLIIAAGDDDVVPFAQQIAPMAAALGARNLTVELTDATHMTFADMCPLIAGKDDAEVGPQCAGTGPLAMGAAHALVGDLIVAELAHVFADGPAPEPAALAAARRVAITPHR
ncbi:MAG: alpha/beta hydrolase [Kofleriaceae bacterium]